MLDFIPPVKKQGIFFKIMTGIVSKETILLIVSIQILLSLTMQSSMPKFCLSTFLFHAVTCCYTIFSQILLLMGQLHTVRYYNSTALLLMHIFMLLMVARVYVYMKLKVWWRERLGEEV